MLVAEREVYKLLEERTISGRGYFKIPADKKYRNFLLYVDVVRLPPVDYLSSKFNPDKSEYGKITWSRDDYVMYDGAVSYQYQVFEYNLDSSGYMAHAVTCMYESLHSYFSYLAPFVNAPPRVIDPTKKIYAEPLQNAPDAIKIVCRSNAAFVCKLYVLKYDVSCPEAESSPKLPPKPVKTPSVPSTTNIGVTPAYDGATDGGNTLPYTGDVIDTPPTPGQEVCFRYIVKVRYVLLFQDSTQQEVLRDVHCYGKIGELALSETNVSHLYLRCQGIDYITDPKQGGASVYSPHQVCIGFALSLVSEESYNPSQAPVRNYTILSITPES